MVDVPSREEYSAYQTEVNHRLGVLENQGNPTDNLLFSDIFDQKYSLTDGQTSPDGKWKLKYLSGGKVSSDGLTLTMYPKVVTSKDQTASTLLLSLKTFKDFQLDIDVKLNKQLRTGSTPNSWETPWLFWSYNDEAEGTLKRSNHHYYWVLKTTGWEWGKKDNPLGNVENEKQIFIKTGTTPIIKALTSYHLTVIKKAFHHTILVNGVVVVDQDDPQVNDSTKMAEGFIGLYEEDSSASFDNLIIKKAG